MSDAWGKCAAHFHAYPPYWKVKIRIKGTISSIDTIVAAMIAARPKVRIVLILLAFS